VRATLKVTVSGSGICDGNIKMKLREICCDAEEWILVKEDTPDVGILC
jgi:hypothetical protein